MAARASAVDLGGASGAVADRARGDRARASPTHLAGSTHEFGATLSAARRRFKEAAGATSENQATKPDATRTDARPKRRGAEMRSGRGRTQPVTAADKRSGQIRIPVTGTTKNLFPSDKRSRSAVQGSRRLRGLGSPSRSRQGTLGCGPFPRRQQGAPQRFGSRRTGVDRDMPRKWRARDLLIYRTFRKATRSAVRFTSSTSQPASSHPRA
jgi:hypothetical protein